MGLKLHIIVNDGSPLGVTLSDLHGENGRLGIGGAETALLTMCEAWAKRGDEVVLYNDPLHPNDVFEQRPLDAFQEGESRDALIIFRSPNQRIFRAVGKRVWWSCDQQTIGDFAAFSKMVNAIVTISPFHSQYFLDTYGIKNSTPIDLPVRTWEYEQEIQRVNNQLIFCSVPDRGLHQLADVWDRITAEVPDASLVITSDYRLWGLPYANNEQFMVKFVRKNNVRFLGAVRRSELVQYQLQSDIHAYPNVYDELFCIACAECQVAGAYPVTSDVGALKTTSMGHVILGSPHLTVWQDKFVSTIVYLLNHRDELELHRWRVQEKARKRFDINNILQQWDEKVFQ